MKSLISVDALRNRNSMIKDMAQARVRGSDKGVLLCSFWKCRKKALRLDLLLSMVISTRFLQTRPAYNINLFEKP